MTKASDNINNQEDYESIQENKNNYWYSIALLMGNIGIIVKVIVELILDRSKSE